MINITNECNMELMARYPDNYFDLAIVDPPYGINADVKNNSNKKQSKKSASKSKKYGSQLWDSNVPTKEYFKQLFRVSKNQIIWGVNYYPYDFLNGGRIYWDKCVSMPTYSDGELAYCSLLNSIKSVKIAWHGMIQHDMKNKEQRIHPTQKPVKLYEWLLINYAKENDKILDTHGGSMSIALAVHNMNSKNNMNLSLDICELDEDYFLEGKKRYENHIKQKTIFDL
jgi:site-specific DNA-methyltransferase (adenine-specific)